MCNEKINYQLKPGEVIPPELLNKLDEVNAKFTKKSIDFQSYRKQLEAIFGGKIPPVTTERNLFLAGFVEGEGSINVSAKTNNNTKFGLEIDPEFSITQHVNGVENLLYAMKYFNTGRISYKSGSNATLIYRISNTQSIREKVLPFFETYCMPYSSSGKKNRFLLFKKLLLALESKKHSDINSMVNDVLPLWFALRMQIGQSNQSFPDLESAQQFVIHKFKKITS